MMRNGYVKTAAVLAVGAALGYLTAEGKLNPFSAASVKQPPREAPNVKPSEPPALAPDCCAAPNKVQMLTPPTPNQHFVNQQRNSCKKPNMVIIWGDDIGQSN